MSEPRWLVDGTWGYSWRLPGDMPARVGLIQTPEEVHDIEDLDALLSGPHGNAVAKRVAWALDAVRGVPIEALTPDALTATRQALGQCEAELREYEGEEGRCQVGHNKRLTYVLDGRPGCVACERDTAEGRLRAVGDVVAAGREMREAYRALIAAQTAECDGDDDHERVNVADAAFDAAALATPPAVAIERANAAERELGETNEALAACQAQAAGRIRTLEGALRQVAFTEDYDGDPPEMIGYQCLLCKQTAERIDEIPHEPTCVLALAAHPAEAPR